MKVYEELNLKFDELLKEVGAMKTHLETTVTKVSKMEKMLTGINKHYIAFSKRLGIAEADIIEINNPTEE